MSFNITPVASGYQEIHPDSAMNINSVKINTSLIMMKEWWIFLNLHHTIVIVDRVGIGIGIGMDRVVDRDRVQLLAI